MTGWFLSQMTVGPPSISPVCVPMGLLDSYQSIVSEKSVSLLNLGDGEYSCVCLRSLKDTEPALPVVKESGFHLFFRLLPVRKDISIFFESKILHMPALAFFCLHSWRRFSWPAHTFGCPNSSSNVENLPSAEDLIFVSKRKSLNLLMFLGNFSKTFPLVPQGQCGQ